MPRKCTTTVADTSRAMNEVTANDPIYTGFSLYFSPTSSRSMAETKSSTDEIAGRIISAAGESLVPSP